jgi:hypothetical protein
LTSFQLMQIATAARSPMNILSCWYSFWPTHWLGCWASLNSSIYCFKNSPNDLSSICLNSAVEWCCCIIVLAYVLNQLKWGSAAVKIFCIMKVSGWWVSGDGSRECEASGWSLEQLVKLVIMLQIMWNRHPVSCQVDHCWSVCSRTCGIGIQSAAR